MAVATKSSRMRRAEIRRRVIYVATAILLLVLAFTIDWQQLQQSFFQPDIIKAMFPDVVLIGVKNTIIYTTLAFSFGLVLALILALMKRSTIRFYRWFATGYIELFRGLPALITIILVAFGLPLALGIRIPGGTLGKGTLGLGLVAGAYMAETIRAGIEA
ncbi:MAG: ABC transporter permease subunit, partial [Acidimicrobiia bacterium]